MTGLTDLDEMIASLEPVLREGEYVFVSVNAEQAGTLPAEATIREDEGITVVLRREHADAARLGYDFVARWITLTVNSSLAAVGLDGSIRHGTRRRGHQLQRARGVPSRPHPGAGR